MIDKTDIINKQFGNYKVLEYSHYHDKNHYYKVECVCGDELTIQRCQVMRNTKTECNGHNKDRVDFQGYTTHPAYRSYYHMVARCNDPKHVKFHLYGGRADGKIVKVDPRWAPNGKGSIEGFKCFIEHMGPKPAKGWTIERRNPHGHYTPYNCYWLPVEMQAKNKRVNTKFKYAADISEYNV